VGGGVGKVGWGGGGGAGEGQRAGGQHVSTSMRKHTTHMVHARTSATARGETRGPNTHTHARQVTHLCGELDLVVAVQAPA
jgi:hypothetical protein